MANWRDRLKSRIKQQGTRNKWVSEKAGLEASYLYNVLKRGRTPTVDHMQKILKALGTSFSEIFDDDADNPGEVLLPYYSVQISAGDGVHLDESHKSGHVGISRSWLSTVTQAPLDRLSVARLRGNSMEPDIADDSLIVIDHAQTSPVNNKVFAFTIGEETRIKKLVVNPTNKTFSLVSANPSWPRIDNVRPADVSIHGRVIASIRSF